MSDSILKSVKVIKFNGKQSDWRTWSAKFMPFATSQEFEDILTGDIVVPNDNAMINVNTKEGKRQLKLRQKNQEAYTALMMSMMDSVCIGAVEAAKTDTFKKGDARQAWENLIEMFQPKTMSNKTALIKQFTNNKLTDTMKNPDNWIDELINICRLLKEFGVNKTEEEILMHVLNNLPKEYNMVVQILEYELDMPNATLNLSKLWL